MITIKLQELYQGFRKGLKASISSRNKTSLTISVSAVTYTIMVLASFPQYSIQLLGNNILFAGTAVYDLSWNLWQTAGITGVLTTGIYAGMTGVALSNLVTQLKVQGSGLKNISAVAPGLLASGCASCGAGILGFIGLTGALAALPFNGNLVRIGGITLLGYFIASAGDPEVCELD